MLRVKEVEGRNRFSVSRITILYGRYNTNFLSSWPNIDYVSVLLETSFEKNLILMSDINPLNKKVCREDIRRMKQPNIKLNVLIMLYNN